jgi:hypothetical protein
MVVMHSHNVATKSMEYVAHHGAWRRIAGTALLVVTNIGCARPSAKLDDQSCGGKLATLHGVTITAAEVTLLIGESGAAGARLTATQALRDILWQESERQRLGLPGGDALTESRREVVKRYRRERASRVAIETQHGLPDGVQMTSCGNTMLAQGSDH